jgi:hypothetical protein
MLTRQGDGTQKEVRPLAGASLQFPPFQPYGDRHVRRIRETEVRLQQREEQGR